MSNGCSTFKDNAEKVVEDVPEESEGSHYPKRKRASPFNNLGESKLESAQTTTPERSCTSSTSANKFKLSRQCLAGSKAKSVLLGTWRDSSVPDDEKKHAVIGFIDLKGHLRTYIQPNTKHGESLAEDYPLPIGAGSRVVFERVILSDHLVGLNHSQVKEYTRLRSEAAPEKSEDGRVAAEHAAVQEAIRRVKENSALENLERTLFAIDPLPGTRPTHVLIGHWQPASEADPKDRHTVYGVLGQSEKFRLKLVRQTRDGRFVDGNYPFGRGAVWIRYEEVEFEPHLKALNRKEVKEYCRVRQHQLDHGETSAERIENETKAVYEAQIRAGTMAYMQPRIATLPTFTASTQGNGDERMNGPNGYGDHELHQSRRTEPRPIQVSLGGNEQHQSRLQNAEAVERTRTRALHEIARIEAAQDRIDHHAIHRERAVKAAAAYAANAAAVAEAALEHHYNTNGRTHFHKSEDMQLLNEVWARHETFPMKSSSDDVKMYDGNKYERKVSGPFVGKLVSRGTIVNIDGQDYVEYRVLTKPSFF